MNIITNYWPKPIPDRSKDWTAVDNDTYGGEGTDPIGYGATEAEAVGRVMCVPILEGEEDAA